MWDTHSGKQRQTLEGHTGSVTSLAFLPDRFELASGSWDGTILLWEIERIAIPGGTKRIGVADEGRQLSECSRLVTALVPTDTALLPNYQNPFSQETWIPYRLKEPAEVALTIYDMKGQAVRTLAVGHRPAGVYQSRERAAYWDGRNQQGETVANGVYFCKMTAGEFRGTQKMLVGK